MNDLIYNQNDIPKDHLRYGFRSSAATGCGWIATYNALRLLNYRAEPEELIAYYERQLPLVHGNAGTSFWGPALRFHQWGFPVKMIADPKLYDEAAKGADTCILYYYWRNKWKMGAHFVALQYKDGEFIGYNTYRNSKGPDHYGPSLQEFLKRNKYFATLLITIQDKRQKEKPES